jgi:hypothetical protein
VEAVVVVQELVLVGLAVLVVAVVEQMEAQVTQLLARRTLVAVAAVGMVLTPLALVVQELSTSVVASLVMH